MSTLPKADDYTCAPATVVESDPGLTRDLDAEHEAEPKPDDYTRAPVSDAGPETGPGIGDPNEQNDTATEPAKQGERFFQTYSTSDSIWRQSIAAALPKQIKWPHGVVLEAIVSADTIIRARTATEPLESEFHAAFPTATTICKALDDAPFSVYPVSVCPTPAHVFFAVFDTKHKSDVLNACEEFVSWIQERSISMSRVRIRVLTHLTDEDLLPLEVAFAGEPSITEPDRVAQAGALFGTDDDFNAESISRAIRSNHIAIEQGCAARTHTMSYRAFAWCNLARIMRFVAKRELVLITGDSEYTSQSWRASVTVVSVDGPGGRAIQLLSQANPPPPVTVNGDENSVAPWSLSDLPPSMKPARENAIDGASHDPAFVAGSMHAHNPVAVLFVHHKVYTDDRVRDYICKGLTMTGAKHVFFPLTGVMNRVHGIILPDAGDVDEKGAPVENPTDPTENPWIHDAVNAVLAHASKADKIILRNAAYVFKTSPLINSGADAEAKAESIHTAPYAVGPDANDKGRTIPDALSHESLEISALKSFDVFERYNPLIKFAILEEYINGKRYATPTVAVVCLPPNVCTAAALIDPPREISSQINSQWDRVMRFVLGSVCMACLWYKQHCKEDEDADADAERDFLRTSTFRFDQDTFLEVDPHNPEDAFKIPTAFAHGMI